MNRDWDRVDNYVADRLGTSDAVLDAALAANARGGLPPIDVSAAQGKFLHVLARGIGARRILEVGTLGGYSTIWLARALPEGGKLITLELEPHHAEIAQANIVVAKLVDRVDVLVGPAAESLQQLDGPFDLIFIDADKPSNVTYVREALRLARPGATIVVDNVVREGGVLETDSDDPRIIGTRALFDFVRDEPRLTATVVQTVGAKKWDGFLIAIVD